MEKSVTYDDLATQLRYSPFALCLRKLIFACAPLISAPPAAAAFLCDSSLAYPSQLLWQRSWQQQQHRLQQLHTGAAFVSAAGLDSAAALAAGAALVSAAALASTTAFAPAATFP